MSDKRYRRSGVAKLYGSCEISSRFCKDKDAIGKVFGADKQELTWDEFIAKCPDDTFGIGQKDSLLDKIRELADKVITKWLYWVSGNSSPVNISVCKVYVNDKRINFDFRCEYEYYCELYVNWYENGDTAWGDGLCHLENHLDNAQEIIECDNVWLAMCIDNYEVGAH